VEKKVLRWCIKELTDWELQIFKGIAYSISLRVKAETAFVKNQTETKE